MTNAFMKLTRAEVAFDEYDEVLVNPAHITEVSVHTYKATAHLPDRALLSLRVQGGNGMTVLALDANLKPLVPADAAQREPSELLRNFNNAVGRTS